MAIEQWWILKYLAAGAYIAIMLAVLGVPQLLSSYFDIRSRRQDRREDKEEARRAHEQAEANADRRHQEMMVMLAGVLSNGQNHSQDDTIRAQQQIIEQLSAENERLRNERSNDNNGSDGQ